MNDKSYIDWQMLNDIQIEVAIGQFVRFHRQQQNKTQTQLAAEANISRSTLSLLERGEVGSIMTLIQVLRILKQLHVFQTFKFSEPVSPIKLAKLERKERERVRGKSSKEQVKKTDW